MLLPILSLSAVVLLRLPPHMSLILGLALALFFKLHENVYTLSNKWSSKILQYSIIAMGANLNFSNILNTGLHGIVVTFISIGLTLVVGSYLAKLFKVSSPLDQLITVGTAICGGSAISAISPVVQARSIDIATAMGVVFLLNAAAIFIFPPIGQILTLSQNQFGTWAALAIHDTSSVVAASQIYGDEALKIGTTLKLTRALWIIPVTILFAKFMLKNKSQVHVNLNKPWFILWFILMSLIFTFISPLHFAIPALSLLAKTGLSLTLFLIGLNLNKSQLQNIGLAPILLGLSLWIFVLSSSLIYVKYFVI
jgi:uncharacterized integral membrane protein (TIGR00698 family)